MSYGQEGKQFESIESYIMPLLDKAFNELKASHILRGDDITYTRDIPELLATADGSHICIRQRVMFSRQVNKCRSAELRIIYQQNQVDFLHVRVSGHIDVNTVDIPTKKEVLFWQF